LSVNGERSGLGLPIAIFASAQFVMVLDSSVMNVSISQIVADLDTTIQGVQLAITAYTLVMAALMLAGAKLGDILGRDRTFAIGLGIYGLGSLTTALSPSLAVLLVGWSLIEGIAPRSCCRRSFRSSPARTPVGNARWRLASSAAWRGLRSPQVR
jgi:MFS family permease